MYSLKTATVSWHTRHAVDDRTSGEKYFVVHSLNTQHSLSICRESIHHTPTMVMVSGVRHLLENVGIALKRQNEQGFMLKFSGPD